MTRRGCALLLLLARTAAADIFVSSSRGADSNSGASPAAPFATLERAAAAADGLADGAVRLRRGDTWVISAALVPRGIVFARLARAAVADYTDDGSLARPRLVRAAPAVGAALTLADSTSAAVAGIEVVGGEYGVLVEFDAAAPPGGSAWVNISVRDCFFQGIAGLNYAPGDSTGWGAAVALVTGAGGPATLSGLTLANNVVNGSDTFYRNYVYFQGTNPVIVAGLDVDANAVVGASFNALFLSLTSAVRVTRNVFLRDAPVRDFTGAAQTSSWARSTRRRRLRTTR